MKFARNLLIISMLVFAVGAAFAPWVYRPPAALQLTAPGLAEYVKFLPEKRLGLLPAQRLHFLLPLLVSALSLPLLAENRALGLNPAWRIGLRLAVVPLALAMLSPVWAPGVLLNDEFRLQTLAAGLAIGLMLIAPMFGRLSLKWLIAGITPAALVATAFALRQFFLVDQAIAATYAGPIVLGWGGWLPLAGLAGLAISLRRVWPVSR